VFEAMIADDRQYFGAPNLPPQRVDEQPLTQLAALAPRPQRSPAVEVQAHAASSAAVLAYIRQALERTGAIQDPLNAEEPAHLLMRLDGKTAVWHLLGKHTTIGRTAENDVRIDAAFISRRHAVALRAGADPVIEDLKSTNGTYVNGERISRRTLKDGDLVRLGTMEFHFSVNSALV